MRDRVLSFVPPDGRFTLFNYRYGPKSNAAVVGSNNLIPFVVKGSIESEQSTGNCGIHAVYLLISIRRNIRHQLYFACKSNVRESNRGDISWPGRGWY